MALRRGLVSLGAVVTCCALTAACTSEPAPASHAIAYIAAATPKRISDRASNETRLRGCRKGVSSQHGGAGSLSTQLGIAAKASRNSKQRLPVATISDLCSSSA